MKKIVLFGEILLRISPKEDGEKIVQATSFRIEPGGSESNVAISLSQLGNDTMMVTRLPKNDLSDKILRYLRSFNIETKFISYGGEKVGIYWTEKGIGPRSSKVLYDRQNSAFNMCTYNDFRWNHILKDSMWLHTSGITPALSKDSYFTIKKILELINDKIIFSIDLNYRDNLWNWLSRDKEKIRIIMEELCLQSTLIVGNETDFQNCLGLNGSYDDIAKECFLKFEKLKYIAISLRKSSSASDNILSGLLFIKEGNEIIKIKGLSYQLSTIIDRIGTGDCFASGIIHGFLNYSNDYKKIIDIAVSLFTIKHTIRGDASQFLEGDVYHMIETGGSGRILR